MWRCIVKNLFSLYYFLIEDQKGTASRTPCIEFWNHQISQVRGDPLSLTPCSLQDCLKQNSMTENVVQALLEFQQAWFLSHFTGHPVMVTSPLSVKRLFRISSLNFPSCSLISFPLVLLLLTGENRSAAPPWL